MPFFENASNFVMKDCTFTRIHADGSKETWTRHDTTTDASPSVPRAESTSTSSPHPSASNTCADPFVNPDDPPILVEEFVESSNPYGVRRRHATRRSRRTTHGNHHSVTTTTTTIVSMNSNTTRSVFVRDSFNGYVGVDGGEPAEMPFRKSSIAQGC
ncbi:hypothetical protein AB1N83_010214 [Pleurotus pulmonarius]